MEIVINDDRKIFAIQKEFSEFFPFLKLGFYSKPSKEDGEHPEKPIKHISKTIAECRNQRSSGHFTIQPQMPVRELAQKFRDIYGLSVSVFRKSGDQWTEANETANWTLEKQNLVGQESANVEKVYVGN